MEFDAPLVLVSTRIQLFRNFCSNQRNLLLFFNHISLYWETRPNIFDSSYRNRENFFNKSSSQKKCKCQFSIYFYCPDFAFSCSDPAIIQASNPKKVWEYYIDPSTWEKVYLLHRWHQYASDRRVRCSAANINAQTTSWNARRLGQETTFFQVCRRTRNGYCWNSREGWTSPQVFAFF